MEKKNNHQFSIRVYAEDTDMMGIVYHANYLAFYERARTEIIRKSGLSLTTLAAYDCHFVITEVKLRYLHPAFLDDLLEVSSQLIHRKSCSVVFDQKIYNQHNKLLSEAEIKVVCVGKEKKPRRLPEDLFI